MRWVGHVTRVAAIRNFIHFSPKYGREDLVGGLSTDERMHIIIKLNLLRPKGNYMHHLF